MVTSRHACVDRGSTPTGSSCRSGKAGSLAALVMSLFSADRCELRPNCHGDSTQKHAPAKMITPTTRASHPGRSRNPSRRTPPQ
jgi:hypothetical protein